MKTIVISAVNMRKGGTLTILRDCLEALAAFRAEHDCRVVALVHRKELAFFDGIEYIELPWSVRSWGHRLWCEYMTMHSISRQLGEVDLWLSLHDTTPRVQARHQAVYCHNSYPFFRWHWRHLLLNYRIVCFALFTRWFYRINIHRNRFLIVQQEWFRNEMSRMFGIDQQDIIVAPPVQSEESKVKREVSSLTNHPSLFTFLYPAFPDVHKNMECLCEAARLLEQEVGADRFQVILTTAPDFNKYSHWIARRWGDVRSLRFCGFLDRAKLEEEYAGADCLVFPSKVETWGLPISEFASTGRPMLLADLPYAHETAAGSRLTAFFDPEDPVALKSKMLRLLDHDLSGFTTQPSNTPAEPTAFGWPALIRYLLLNPNLSLDLKQQNRRLCPSKSASLSDKVGEFV